MRSEAARLAKRMIAAKFDAAQHTDEDRRYWSLVDDLSADAALSPEVRRVVRNRARYEAGNGGYCKGMVRQKANDLIGTGPRLQITKSHVGPDGVDVNKKLEAEWILWSRKSFFARTLRTACRCRIRDGAALGIISSCSKLPTLAKVKFRLVDIDRLHTPQLSALEKDRIDGIDFDAEGDPEWYWILDIHPGASIQTGMPTATRHPASSIIHWFDEDRAEQHHGLSELAPSLRTFANHRRMLRATIRAIEVAAEIAAFFTNQNPPDDEDGEDGESWHREVLDVIDMEFGGVMVAPDGDDVKQVESKHPNTNFAEFNEATVAEESRPLLMSSNVANGNFNNASYASGRCETQISNANDLIDRDDIEIFIVEPIAEQWLRETLSEMSDIAPSDIDISDYPHEWQWDHREQADPTKASDSQDTDLHNGSLTFPTLYAQKGKDWHTEFEKQAEALGVTFEEFQGMVRRALFDRTQSNGGKLGSKPETDSKDEENEDNETAGASAEE